MGKAFILTLLFFIADKTSNFAQALFFSDLKYLLQHDVESSDAYLAKKGYLFMKSNDADTEKRCPSTTWSFQRNKNNNRAEAFIVKYCDIPNDGFIWYQFEDKELFQSIREHCKNTGFKFTKKETDPFGSLCFIFASKEFEIEFCSGLNDNNENDYTITLKPI